MFKHIFKLLCLASLLAITPPALAATSAQASFDTPEAAGKALAAAVEKQDKQQLLSIVGPNSASWLFSGDKTADHTAWKKFLIAYTAKNSITQASDGRAFLLVGEDGWPFPAPLVKTGTAWRFDAEAGQDEIVNRRVGRNELNTIQTLLAIVDAQREYATDDPDKNGFHDYARRFLSNPGKRDGLYWPTSAGMAMSPLGPAIAEAAQQGYSASGNSAKPSPYHGYLFRMLTAQDKDATGGAYSYMVGSRMIGGFAVIAYPAKYGNSGVMTFIVNHDGVVYERDLGKATADIAAKTAAFNPGSGWKKSQ